MSMDRKTALITGASHGIGYATAKLLYQKGWTLVCISRDLDQIFYKDPFFKSDRIQTIRFNFENVKDIEKIPIYNYKFDAVINNAGMMPMTEFLDYTIDQMWNVTNVNLLAPIELTKQILGQGCLKPEANIINVASVSGVENEDYLIMYATLKAAIIHFTKCLAKNLGSDGIRVNAISPGLTNTNLVDSKIPNELLEDIPASRAAEPEEIAKSIYHLICGEYITGHNLVIDGGKSL